MKYRTLPGTGISVSNLALGTMGFGTETDQADAFAILDRFVESDGNLVDTSNVYGGGASEELLGRWFASRPADTTGRVVPATKARFGTGPDTNENGSSRRNTPIEETLSFLDDAVHAGKVSYIGLSNLTGWQMQLTLSTAKALRLQVPVTLQPQYSLVSREIEYEVVPAALRSGIGLLPWSPLAGGFLSGKYRRGDKAASDTRAGTGDPMFAYIFGNFAAKDQNWATPRAGSVTLPDPQPAVARMLDLLCIDEMFSIRHRTAGDLRGGTAGGTRLRLAAAADTCAVAPGTNGPAVNLQRQQRTQ